MAKNPEVMYNFLIYSQGLIIKRILSKKLRGIFSIIFSVAIALTSCTFLNIAEEYKIYAAQEDVETLLGQVEFDKISDFGNVSISISKNKAAKAGYEAGDIVTVSFLNQSLTIPFVTNYNDVDPGEAGLISYADYDNLLLAVCMGDFATTYGIATKTTLDDNSCEWSLNEGVSEPIEVTVEKAEKQGYLDEYKIHQLSYTTQREDYPNLSDEEYANFREVTTTGIGKGILYRSAFPIDDSKGRAKYADAAIEKAGVTIAINLSNDDDTIKDMDGYSNTYYSTIDYIALNMALDMQSDEFREKWRKALYICRKIREYM